MKTYTLQVNTGSEHKAKENLLMTISKNNMQDIIGEIIIPEQEVKENKNGKTVTKKIKLLPNYILIEMSPTITKEQIRLLVSTNKVQGFLGINAYTPIPMTDEEKNKFLNLTNLSDSVSLVNEGDKVKIITGPFTNFEGVVVSVSGQKVKVNISVFGRQTPVDILANELTKLS